MKKNKRLDPIIDQAVKASFKDGRLLELQTEKLAVIFKKLPLTDAIYLTQGFLKAIKREAGKHTLVVESVIPLSGAEVMKLKKNLPGQLKINNERLVINPNLLGGVRARVGDTVYDLSLKGKLGQIKEAIHG